MAFKMDLYIKLCLWLGLVLFSRRLKTWTENREGETPQCIGHSQGQEKPPLWFGITELWMEKRNGRVLQRLAGFVHSIYPDVCPACSNNPSIIESLQFPHKKLSSAFLCSPKSFSNV